MSTIVTNPEVRHGIYVANFIEDDLSYGVGAIGPLPEYEGRQVELAQAVVESIEEVKAEELPYSCCTDGRCPDCLKNGEPVPVREQVVGADAMTAFHIAEVLGERFYTNSTAPVEERIDETLQFLLDNGFKLGTHFSCGAAEGYLAILANMNTFGQTLRFNERTKLFVPESVYDDQLAAHAIDQARQNLSQNKYEGYGGGLVLDAVQRKSGDRAVAKLINDGRGVAGHVEEMIVRLDESIRGFAINEARLTEVTNGREVFGVNNGRIAALAEVFGRGLDTDYRIARIAAEQFTNAGHATLAKNLPTLVVEHA